MLINIDIDNTVNDFIDKFLVLYNRISNKNIQKKDVLNYDLTSLGTDRPTLETLFFKNSAFHEQLEPVDGAVDVIKMLHDFGHKIKFVTSINYGVVQPRVNFVKHYFPFIDEDESLLVTSGKRWIWSDIVIDDHIDNLVNVNPDCKFIVYSQPWNTNITIEDDNTKGFRASSWYDILDWCVHNKLI